MSLNLSVILPKATQTLNGIGFIFGSGSSFEAGYPMMPELTRKVINALKSGERDILDEVLNHVGETYNDATAIPNIEHISDLVIAHWTNSGNPKFSGLETRLRELILEIILAVESPNLDNHCIFFDSLKRRCFGIPSTIWIFTTNYDLLFEVAAARNGVLIENGFCGATERFFYPRQFRSTSGVVAGKQFSPHSLLTVKLVKLHGSISWVEEDSNIYERHPNTLGLKAKRIMVLPRRKKVMDTLIPPYDTLFNVTSKVLGGECKYLVSCGYSFGDEHINQHLILPVIQANKCRLFTLCQDEPDGIAIFKDFPTFQAGFENGCYIDGKSVPDKTDLWKFSKFVEMFRG